MSFRQLESDVVSLALAMLREKGKPEKAAIISVNCYEWCVSYLACLSAGIVAVPVDRELSGADIKDIPVYARNTTYDIASLTSDFMSFVCPPIADAKRGRAFVLNQDYFIEGEGKILIPASVKGVFDICYNRKPREVTSEGMETGETIDLNDELCAILPNLVASYIWVDDEPDKAQYYLSLYREQVAEIAAREKDMRPFVYRNKTGW